MAVLPPRRPMQQPHKDSPSEITRTSMARPGSEIRPPSLFGESSIPHVIRSLLAEAADQAIGAPLPDPDHRRRATPERCPRSAEIAHCPRCRVLGVRTRATPLPAWVGQILGKLHHPPLSHPLLSCSAYPLSMATNPRIAAISWLVRGTKELTEGETFVCQSCGVAYSPVVLELAHRSPVRKDRSGGFQAQVFAKQLLALPIEKAQATARVLCANCHRVETATQQRSGWS
jgi:hypothetical protein